MSEEREPSYEPRREARVPRDEDVSPEPPEQSGPADLAEAPESRQVGELSHVPTLAEAPGWSGMRRLEPDGRAKRAAALAPLFAWIEEHGGSPVRVVTRAYRQRTGAACSRGMVYRLRIGKAVAPDWLIDACCAITGANREAVFGGAEAVAAARAAYQREVARLSDNAAALFARRAQRLGQHAQPATAPAAPAQPVDWDVA